MSEDTVPDDFVITDKVIKEVFPTKEEAEEETELEKKKPLTEAEVEEAIGESTSVEHMIDIDLI
jgi:hypothetical protein